MKIVKRKHNLERSSSHLTARIQTKVENALTGVGISWKIQKNQEWNYDNSRRFNGGGSSIYKL